MADMFKFSLKDVVMHPALTTKLDKALLEAQKYIDSECLRRCAPLMPFDQHTLIESGPLNTQIGSGEVKWRTPYARRWYYMPANFSKEHNKEAGNYWFERMKQQQLEQIRKGAQAVINQNL